VELIRDRFPEDPARDAAVTHALLRQVGEGKRGPVARVFRPGPTMAFGRLDALSAGYDAARDAARDHGYEPLLRLGGGHAAGYDEGAILVEVIRPVATIAEGVHERFEWLTALLVETLAFLGITARVGELPGEYCAGEHSVNAAGVKLAGTAQRTIKGASLVTAMLIAQGGGPLRAALTDVYAALDIDWRPQTAAAANDIVPSLTAGDAERALIATLAARERLTAGALGAGALALADRLRAGHLNG
jgi:octanoyl-[GcvH]:protein N-octanoyltransferase